jgi:hypothetical protein
MAPVKVVWPELTLTGTNERNVLLVCREFIRQGWDADQIKARIGGDPEVVKAIVAEGDVDIPIGAQGLDSLAEAAIEGIVASYRPVSSNRSCYHQITLQNWRHPTADGSIIVELRRPYGWEYKYGRKSGQSLTFTRCIQSDVRLDLPDMPWQGKWTLVTENSPTTKSLVKDEIIRAWINTDPPGIIKIEPLKVLRR